MPAFPSIDEVNELLEALINGLWNELTVHQDETQPYRLTPMPARATRQSLTSLVETRADEIHGFLTGIFGDQETLEVPESMADSLDTLVELGEVFSGMQTLLEDPEKAASLTDLKALKVHIAELTHIVEQEIHAVVIVARVLREHEGAMEEKTGRAVHLQEPRCRSCRMTWIPALVNASHKRIEQGFGWIETVGGLGKLLLVARSKARSWVTWTFAAYSLIRFGTIGVWCEPSPA